MTTLKYYILVLVLFSATLLTAQDKQDIIYFNDFGGNETEADEVCKTPLQGCYYKQITNDASHSGSYSLRKKAFFNGNHNTKSQWYTQSDHTYDKDYTKGYFLQIDGSLEKKPFYQFTITNAPTNSKLEFSFWIVNCYTAYQKKMFEKDHWKIQEPTFEIIITDNNGTQLARETIGPIHADETLDKSDDYKFSATWQEISFEFNTGNTSTISVTFFNTGIKSPGNDFGIDDIKIKKGE